jgi:methyltransferase, FkbM family
MLNILFPKGSARRTFLSRIKMHLHGTCEGARKNVFRVIFSLSPFKIDKKITYQGFSLHYSPGTSIVERFKKNGSYEPEEVAALALVAVQDERPTVFLDIGANIGMISLAVLRHVPKATIYAFEPGQHQREYLEKNILANQLEKSIKAFPLALSDKRGSALFAVHDPSDASGDGLRDTGRAGGCSFVEVQTDTLDNWWQENGCPAVTLIKMDVEGAEFFVLQGATKLLTTCRPVILLEAHATNLKAYGLNVHKLLSAITEYGYKICSLDQIEATEELLMQFNDDGYGLNFIAFPPNWRQ